MEEAIKLDGKNGNTYWQDAMKKEVDALVQLDCFRFEKSGYKPGKEYQSTILFMVFDVKQDLRRKARLVAGGHLIDPLDHEVYSSTVKGISVRLLQVIAHKEKYEILCGDVGNAFPTAYTNEKIYAIAGKEFGARAGRVIIIVKALYGLATSGERWHSMFADTLRGLNFVPTRYDSDVWIRRHEDGSSYEYLCVYVDDFMVYSRTAKKLMEEICSIYTVKSVGPPDYYLGNDYKQDSQGRWCVGCKRYIKEAIIRVEGIFGELKKYTHPQDVGDHPELDNSEILGDSDHKKYQMLIGMLVWLNTLGRSDISHATASLSRFTACPRVGHLDRVLRVFGYLKMKPNRRIVIDSDDPGLTGAEEALSKDYTLELGSRYPDSFEEIDVNLPEPIIDEIKITTFVDSDHAHDKIMRRSITGMIIFAGKTPIFSQNKRQGSIESSTYGAEFCAMRSAVEETRAVRYMLRCLGVKVEYASLLCGDNEGVIVNATISSSLLKKKHVAIAYHQTREAAAAGIIHPIKIKGERNIADVMTKAQTAKLFKDLTNQFMS